MPQATLDQVRTVLMEQLGVDESAVTLDALIEEDFGADEIDSVEIQVTLEQLFDIVIPDALIESARTVADLVALVDARVAAAEEARGAPVWKK